MGDKPEPRQVLLKASQVVFLLDLSSLPHLMIDSAQDLENHLNRP